MADLPRQELEEAVELVCVAAHGRGERGRVALRRRLERPHLHLQAPAEALDPAEHAHGVAGLEAPVEQLHVVPHPRLDAPARVDELEREVGRAATRPSALLAADREHPLHGAVLRELGDRRHDRESRGRVPGRLAAMADVAPFRAIRYAHPAPELTAPPYDVLTPEQRDAYRARDPHNVVHLTLNESEEEAGRLFRAWLDEGVLVQDDEPAAWVVAQDYVGPDGVGRRREGIVASLRVEPYEARVVLPHERTHAGPKESRLRLLRAAQAQLEPIFLLYDGEPPATAPARDPDLAAEGTSLWRLPGDGLAEAFADRQLLIADGHHRYETALAYAAERGTPESARMMVVLVSTADPGLEIFPTHRLFSGHADIVPGGAGMPVADASAALAACAYDRAHAVAYAAGKAYLLDGAPGELDVELVERLVGHEEIGYTADGAEAVARVEAGEFDGAFLLRPTRIEDVFERARRGEVMPQKTTYFFPKLTSGLLFHPV